VGFLLAAALVVGVLLALALIERPAPDSAPEAPPPAPTVIDVAAVRPAAESGDAEAQRQLGLACARGLGVPQNYAEAAQWYRRAAEQGNAQAQYHLGTRYRDGDGLPLDWVEAHKWLSMAAAQGLPDAVQARDELKRRMTRDQIAESQRRIAAFSPTAPTRQPPGREPNPN
jgi:TPR repeat protein